MAAMVAVGYDGSEHSQLALKWAADFATASGARLRVVHAWIWPLFTQDVGPVEGVADSGLRHAAEVIVKEGCDIAAEISPDLKVDARMVAGLPGVILRQESLDASLLVVGSRGLGSFLGKLVGSVSLDLAGGCPCPLVVVRAQREEGRPVVACVDGHLRSSKVLEQSIRVAHTLQTELRIVHVEHAGPRWKPHRTSQSHSRDVLRNAMLWAQEMDPNLAVTEQLLTGQSVTSALIAAGGEAELLVLGAHGREGHPGTLTTVLAHARCNVMIAR
jgi:nucleotide-binding universal stress UspA family protein